MIAPVIDHEQTLNFLGELSRREKLGSMSAVKLNNGRSLRLMKNQRTGEIRAAYDAAQTTEANKNYWANADLLSADAANSREIRQTLRSRARYECHEGNTFARSIVNKLARDTINRGPQLQMQLKNTDANTSIETRFSTWAKRIKLAKKLRTVRKAKYVDGEVFIRLVTNRKLKGPIKLDLEVIEADRVTNPLGFDDESREIDGVVFDDEGNVVGYRVLKAHPGGNSILSSSPQPEFVPAEQMIHLFREDRPGQHRGIPECTTALPLFILFREYILAVVQNARSVAKHTVLMKTAAGAVFSESESGVYPIDPFEAVDIDYDMQTYLPEGWEPFQLRTDQPATTLEMFRRAIWGEIALTADMPYNIAAGDSSKLNYASGRLDHQPYDFGIEMERGEIEADGLDVILEAWFDEAVLLGLIPEGIGQFDELPHEWYWPSKGHVDPSKEANGQATRLRNGTTNRRRELKQDGVDLDTHDEEAAEANGVTVEEYRRAVFSATFNLQAQLAENDETQLDDTDDDEEIDDDEETAETREAVAA